MKKNIIVLATLCIATFAPFLSAASLNTPTMAFGTPQAPAEESSEGWRYTKGTLKLGLGALFGFVTLKTGIPAGVCLVVTLFSGGATAAIAASGKGATAEAAAMTGGVVTASFGLMTILYGIVAVPCGILTVVCVKSAINDFRNKHPEKFEAQPQPKPQISYLA